MDRETEGREIDASLKRQDIRSRIEVYGECPNHPGVPKAANWDVCWRCYAESKSDPYDAAHGYDR